MSGKLLARACAIFLALILTACGGDDNSSPLAGSPDSGNGGGTPTTPSEDAEVGTVELVANPIRLDTSANASSNITARVKDSNGILLQDVPVSFSANNGGTLEVTQQVTDQAGVASASLTTDSDPRNRTVTVTAQAGGVSNSLSVEISGTSISISGPSSISLGGSATYRVTLSDADGNGIAGQPITLSTNRGTLSASNSTSSSNGSVDVQLSGGNTGGTATITASAYSGSSQVSATQDVVIAGDSFAFTAPDTATEVDLGVEQQVTIEWQVDGNPVADGSQVQFSATRGTLNPPTGLVTTSGGEASVGITSTNSGTTTVTATDPDSGLSADLSFEFVATTPDSINLQASKTQLDLGETTEIIAVIRDASNNLVKNQEVSFRILEDGSGGNLTSSLDVTDSQGRASTIYTAGSNTSPRDGVEIEAVVDGSISDTVTLTVARQALRLAIGTGNEIEEPDSVRYVKEYVAIVTDANGAPVENANIELSALPVGYQKGSYQPSVDNNWVISPASPVFCAAEDANQNGQLDPGEDTNNNMKLEPTNSAATSASSITSASDGSASFSLLYPQSHCNWVQVELTATVRVGGSESVETSRFFLSCLASDLNNTDISPPGGTEGLYGVAQDCTVDDFSN